MNGFAPAYGYAPPGYGSPFAGLAQPGFAGWNIVGAAGDPAAAAVDPNAGPNETTMQKAQFFLSQPTFGIKRGYLLAAAALTAAGIGAYEAGWLGGKKRSRRR